MLVVGGITQNAVAQPLHTIHCCATGDGGDMLLICMVGILAGAMSGALEVGNCRTVARDTG